MGLADITADGWLAGAVDCLSFKTAACRAAPSDPYSARYSSRMSGGGQTLLMTGGNIFRRADLTWSAAVRSILVTMLFPIELSRILESRFAIDLTCGRMKTFTTSLPRSESATMAPYRVARGAESFRRILPSCRVIRSWMLFVLVLYVRQICDMSRAAKSLNAQ